MSRVPPFVVRFGLIWSNMYKLDYPSERSWSRKICRPGWRKGTRTPVGVAGNAPPEEIEQLWMFKGYLATLFYAPSMAVCGGVEWWSLKRDKPRLRIAVRLFRWAHFLVAMGPIIVLFASVFLYRMIL